MALSITHVKKQQKRDKKETVTEATRACSSEQREQERNMVIYGLKEPPSGGQGWAGAWKEGDLTDMLRDKDSDLIRRPKN